jgi:hypothetical protein
MGHESRLRSKRSLRARRGQQGPQVQLGQLVHKDRGFLEGGAGASAPATSAPTSAVTAAWWRRSRL